MKAPLWLRHWGLSEAPFDKDIDADELWLPSSKEELVTQLVDAAHARCYRARTSSSACPESDRLDDGNGRERGPFAIRATKWARPAVDG